MTRSRLTALPGHGLFAKYESVQPTVGLVEAQVGRLPMGKMWRFLRSSHSLAKNSELILEGQKRGSQQEGPCRHTYCMLCNILLQVLIQSITGITRSHKDLNAGRQELIFCFSSQNVGKKDLITNLQILICIKLLVILVASICNCMPSTHPFILTCHSMYSNPKMK